MVFKLFSKANILGDYSANLGAGLLAVNRLRAGGLNGAALNLDLSSTAPIYLLFCLLLHAGLPNVTLNKN